jgi:hypothetical protein
MKLVGNLLRFVLLSCIITTTISSCTDPNRVMDENTSITNHNWGYGNKVKFDVQINDAAIPYNLYLNLRVTANYRYSNMWLGKGSGSMYSYQIPFKTGYRFPSKGRYHFEIEQNMRDNPLRSVSDVGLRVEQSQ